MPPILEVDVYEDDGIHHVALRSAAYAEAMGRLVEFTFNGVQIFVWPGRTASQILDWYFVKHNDVFCEKLR